MDFEDSAPDEPPLGLGDDIRIGCCKRRKSLVALADNPYLSFRKLISRKLIWRGELMMCYKLFLSRILLLSNNSLMLRDSDPEGYDGYITQCSQGVPILNLNSSIFV